LDDDVEKVRAGAEPVLGNQQVPGAGDGEEFGEAFEDAQQQGGKQVGHGERGEKGRHSIVHRSVCTCMVPDPVFAPSRCNQLHPGSATSFENNRLRRSGAWHGHCFNSACHPCEVFPMSLEQIEKLIKDNQVEFIDLRFTDMRGIEQHVTFPVSIIEPSLFEEGKMFDGSSIAGWKGIAESDMVLLPDADSAYVDPFYADP